MLHIVNWLGSVRETQCVSCEVQPGIYIPEDGILHSHRREDLKSCISLTGWVLWQRRNVFPVKYDVGFYIPEDGIRHLYIHPSMRLHCVVLIS
jgi:hypothetical protein